MRIGVPLMARIGWDQQVCGPWPFHTTGRAVFLAAVGIAWKSSQSRAAQNATKIGEGIAEKRAQGKNVFVDSTAERCVTCKVNERVTIKAETTKKAFAHNNVEFVIADWTNPAPTSPRCSRSVAKPDDFSLFDPADPNQPAIMIKEGIITSGDILNAIEQLPK